MRNWVTPKTTVYVTEFDIKKREFEGPFERV